MIAKYQRRFPDFDDKIISMYARGLSVREIRAHLEEIYGIEVSPDLISAVTDFQLPTSRHVAQRLHERTSVIVTTNLAFGEWPMVSAIPG